MWPPVISAGLTRLCKSAVQDCFRLYRQISGGGLHTAPPMQPKPTPNLPPPLGLEDALHRRAMRLCNREPRAIAQYMQTHQNLHRGN